MQRTVLLTALVLILASVGASQAWAAFVCVNAPRANLRAGPGTEHRITWEVNRYMPLEEVGREGDWVKVRDVDGDIHWIFDKLISTELRCVTISQPKANVRSKPTTGSQRWFTVEKYSSFERTGSVDKWVKVEYEGQTMWIYDSLVWPN